MLISMAYAQEAVEEAAVMAGETPGTAAQILDLMLPIIVLVFLFYFLLIRPQQKRFQEHKVMLDGLKKGDQIVTSGGLVGKVDKLSGDDEVVVDLGNNVKVTALRHTIQNKVDKDEKKKETKK